MNAATHRIIEPIEEDQQLERQARNRAAAVPLAEVCRHAVVRLMVEKAR